MTIRSTVALAAIITVFFVAACGGGGSGQPMSSTSPNPPPNEPVQPTQSQIHTGVWLTANNPASLSWYANLHMDLPQDGQDGLQVERPQGGAAVPDMQFSPFLRDRLEPGWRFDDDALERLQITSLWLWQLANKAYLQWTRHLNVDPGLLEVQVGDPNIVTCHSALACYVPALNAVILSDDWIATNYANLIHSLATGNEAAYRQVAEHLFFVLSHEAGHQLDYMNPDGTMDGCGGATGCHAPYGSGSVISYDHLVGDSVRYHVTEDDIRHVPNATWNSDNVDRYTVTKSGSPSSIDSWGVWIDHHFEVSGRTTPGQLWGGNLSIVDEISGIGLVQGKPSENVSLTATATWSGEDNFLGVDFHPDFLGALLRADANLRYSFGERPNLSLRVNNFEAHYFGSEGVAGWHDHSYDNWGDFQYSMDCTSDGCSGDSAEAKWYPSDAGDPSGWIGGVVSDQDNTYTGSFVAEKD